MGIVNSEVVALYLYNTQNYHMITRKSIVDYIAQNGKMSINF